MKNLVAFALAFLLVAPVFAQDTPAETTDEVRWVLATAQLEQSLENPQDAIRSQTLKNAIVLATLYTDKVDLSGTARSICKIYRNASSKDHRNLALAALQAIGSTRAKDCTMRNTTPAQYEEGRLTVASVLNDFYDARMAAEGSSS